MDTLAALQAALRAGPCSQRALVKAAGLKWTAVAMRIKRKSQPTPEMLEQVAAALERWSADCAAAAKALRRTIKKEGSHAKS
jgi:hypothetical protein